MKPNRIKSWTGYGTCKMCGGDVRNCSSSEPDADYEYFCSNENCENNVGTHLWDVDNPPDWIELDDRWK